MPLDTSMAVDSADQEQPVYQGGAFADINTLGTKLGGNVSRDIESGRHTINGQYVPWVTAAGGQYRASVHDITQAAGGRVQRGANGSYQVYAPKAPQTPTGGTSVTGNAQPVDPGPHLPMPMNPTPIPGLAVPLNPLPVQPLQPMPMNPLPGDPLRRVAPGYGGPPVPGTGNPMRPPIGIQPPPMAIMGTGAQTDATPLATMGATTNGISHLTPEDQEQLRREQAARAPVGAPVGAPQQITNPPPATTPPGFHFTPQVTPAAQQLGAGAIAGAIKSGEITAAQVAANGRAAGLDPSKQLGYPPASGPASQAPAGPQQPDGPPQYQLPDFNYQAQPLDYNAMQQRAALEAQMWADPYLQQLRDAATLAQQRNANERGYVNQGLQDNIAQLRAGEPAREQRIGELMNKRGDALYGSGVHLGAVRDQQVQTIQQEGKLTNKAQNALSKLADTLGLTLQDITSKTNMITRQQGDKAFLTLQQLADKAQTRQFENHKLAWQMWQGGAQLTIEQQKMANQLWTSNQQIKSADARAAADRSLKLAIANGQLEAKYTEIFGQDAQGHPTFAAQKWAQQQVDDSLKATGYARMPDGSLVRSIDGQKFDLSSAEAMSKQLGYVIGTNGKPLLDGDGQPVRTLEGAKFDWDQKKFGISEGHKVDYQNAMIKLREADVGNRKAYDEALVEIRKGELSIHTSQLLGQFVDHNGNIVRDASGNPVQTEQARHDRAMETKPTGGNPNAAANTAWKSALSELSFMDDPMKLSQYNPAQVRSVAEVILNKWLPQLSPQDQQALRQYLAVRLPPKK